MLVWILNQFRKVLILLNSILNTSLWDFCNLIALDFYKLFQKNVWERGIGREIVRKYICQIRDIGMAFKQVQRS